MTAHTRTELLCDGAPHAELLALRNYLVSAQIENVAAAILWASEAYDEIRLTGQLAPDTASRRCEADAAMRSAGLRWDEKASRWIR